MPQLHFSHPRQTFRIIFFDCDSTLVTIEGIDEPGAPQRASRARGGTDAPRDGRRTIARTGFRGTLASAPADTRGSGGDCPPLLRASGARRARGHRGVTRDGLPHVHRQWRLVG